MSIDPPAGNNIVTAEYDDLSIEPPKSAESAIFLAKYVGLTNDDLTMREPQSAAVSYSFEENAGFEPGCGSYFSNSSPRPSGCEGTCGNDLYRQNSTSSAPTIIRMVPSSHKMRRNLGCDPVDDENCEEGYPVFRCRIAKQGYNSDESYWYVIREGSKGIAKERYQSHLIDQSVTEYAVINRKDMHSLSEPNQSPSENAIILAYQNLRLCLIKCICKATIQLRSLAFWMPTLWLFG